VTSKPSFFPSPFPFFSLFFFHEQPTLRSDGGRARLCVHTTKPRGVGNLFPLFVFFSPFQSLLELKNLSPARWDRVGREDTASSFPLPFFSPPFFPSKGRGPRLPGLRQLISRHCNTGIHRPPGTALRDTALFLFPPPPLPFFAFGSAVRHCLNLKCF